MSRSLSCSNILQIKNIFLKNVKQNQPLKNTINTMTCRHLCYLSNTNIDAKKAYTPFSELLQFRKAEAKKSIIVQVQSAQSSKELHAYCNKFGTVAHMFHYTSGVEPLHFILIEFATAKDVMNILATTCHIEDNQAVPVKSPFLWFRISNNKISGLKLTKDVKLDLENGNKLLSNEAITELMKSSENISDQMRVLYELTKLNDLGIRLRFLTARQIELAVAGMFPDATAYPFGSSINGYGKLGCDLDVILKLHANNKANLESRLIYQCKAGLGNERSQSQRHMEAIGDLLHLFLPGCTQVRRILQARVPILKYYQQFTGIECDLSMTNMTALHMSEILYLFGSIDDRVRPLVFTIRKWAHEVGLTNSSPGRWITNFSLTLLVLAFLQRTSSQPVLPSLNSLIKLAGNVNNLDEKEINYLTFQDINKIKITEKNTDTLGTLLLHFFEYYSNFDFTTKAISLNEASVITKPEYSPLYIVNPLERVLNVSKNVSLEEVERFKIELRNAAWSLESQEKRTGKWGVLSIFNNAKDHRNLYIAPTKYNRMMEVKKLFEDEEISNKENLNIEYKNESVKKEIENIKKDTEIKIQEITHHEKMKNLPRRHSSNVKRR